MNQKDQIKALANSILFDLNDDELLKIENEFDLIKAQLDMINKLNLNLESTNFINQKILIDDLNNDLVQDYNNEDVFANSKNYNGKYVVINDEKQNN